jgi:hypothetical protein
MSTDFFYMALKTKECIMTIVYIQLLLSTKYILDSYLEIVVYTNEIANSDGYFEWDLLCNTNR